jgi:pantoate--beta-alanine ligase
MRIVRTVRELRSATADRGRVGFVATMGNLHEGHAQLARVGRQGCDLLVGSIFVNRLQFGGGEDFTTYPRTFDEDSRLFEAEGVDVLFAPDDAELYPEPQSFFIEPPPISNELCGVFRPGHFRGVATVVMKLFQCVRPDVSWFGKKDYQQWMIIRQMVRQFAMPVEVVGVETVRAADGVALSSRNGYLDAAQRVEAAQLVRALERIRDALRAGRTDVAALCDAEKRHLDARGWHTDYFEVRRQMDLAPATRADRDLVVLGASRLGRARLIDNLEWSQPAA